MTRNVSFVIPWHNRRELRQALAENEPVFADFAREVFIVNFGGDQAMLETMVADFDRHLTILDIRAPEFNKCLALNLGVWHAQSDNVFLLDADIIIDKDLLAEAGGMLRNGTFVTVRKGRELDPPRHPQTLAGTPCLAERLNTSELLFADGRTATLEFWQGAAGRALSGLMLIRKADYVAVEGSNSALFGWGFEDYDLQIRLQIHLGLERVSASYATHITHPVDELSNLSASEARNVGTAMANYTSGNFFGTYSSDAETWIPKTVIVRQ